ncbi:hypothetical protein PISMIDRAFT_672970 [Pisolithus microcarpus 441]|uniref:Uncharacterized protein n=1 Tax=Pisolithus microcarpus 441 TaxID=765257 RepID=A0A0C9ZRS2_9AGAM|nr:hypothetical protein PISMIDRAFT_672970 [Pisolithus microcarpus 441]
MAPANRTVSLDASLTGRIPLRVDDRGVAGDTARFAGFAANDPALTHSRPGITACGTSCEYASIASLSGG